MFSKKRCAAVAAVLVVTPLAACTSASPDGPTASSSASLSGFNPGFLCQQGNQTNFSWTSGQGTLGYNVVFFPTGMATYTDGVGRTWETFAGIGFGSSTVDWIVWVQTSDVPNFEYANMTCFNDPYHGEGVGGPNSGGGGPTCARYPVETPSQWCMDEFEFDAITWRSLLCYENTYVAPVYDWCGLTFR